MNRRDRLEAGGAFLETVLAGLVALGIAAAASGQSQQGDSLQFVFSEQRADPARPARLQLDPACASIVDARRVVIASPTAAVFAWTGLQPCAPALLVFGTSASVRPFLPPVTCVVPLAALVAVTDQRGRACITVPVPAGLPLSVAPPGLTLLGFVQLLEFGQGPVPVDGSCVFTIEVQR